MGIFSKIFKTRKRKINKTMSPTEFFALLGPTMSDFWSDFIKGQNEAVVLFNQYKSFQSKLDMAYSSIDFERFIYNLTLGEESLEIKVKHAMYLYMLNLKKDYYIKLDEFGTTHTLTSTTYNNIISGLLQEEIDYCNELVKYIEENIYQLVNKVGKTLYDIKICRHVIPLNSLNLCRYHAFIAEGKTPANSEEYKKWHYIDNIPFLYRIIENSPEDPLVITEVTATSAFVLDYLHYATICIPTKNINKLLYFKNEQGSSVRDNIVDTFGQEAMDYIIQVLDDMNGLMFRISVYKGMLMQ